jgi:hypothetical protein
MRQMACKSLIINGGHTMVIVGRDTSEKKVNEQLMLELFRRRSLEHVTMTDLNDWELLAIAQHHGLATRLLGWTRTPLVAPFCASDHRTDITNMMLR